ncbi:MAG: NAD-dependent epimerase/dehydratase family protein [Alphaproteobacteria bacterium]|nr:NAD-dependent epimerase/dehydratase family protein [Alphaproteobacteria bacterium]
MKAFVTGASGFVGSAVVRKLLARGASVRVLVRPSSPTVNLANLDVETVRGDLNEPQTLTTGLRGCDALFHVAADYRLWARDPSQIYRTNVDGSVAIVRAAAEAGVARIVYTSSVAVLGLNKDGTPADEETPVSLADMVGDYKRSKYLAEEQVRRLVSEQQAPVVIVNPSTPIGPRDVRPTPTGRIIIEAATGKMPGFVDTGLNFAHVDDVAEGHLQAFDRGQIGRRYILGGENLSFRGFLELVAQCSGAPTPKMRIPHDLVLPIAHVVEWWTGLTGGDEPFVTVAGVRQAKKLMYFSTERAERELGYQARPAKQAVIDALSWFAEQQMIPASRAPRAA